MISTFRQESVIRNPLGIPSVYTQHAYRHTLARSIGLDTMIYAGFLSYGHYNLY